MGAESGFVAVLVVDLHFPEAGSLKSKRKDLQSIKALLGTRFGASVAETAFHDLWQRARLTVTLVSGRLPHLLEMADHVERWLEDRSPAGVRIERLVVSAEDLRDLAAPLGSGG